MQHAWYVVAFGANQGDARAMLDEVTARWSALDSVRRVRCSKLYASVPVGTHRTSAYHNAVLIVESTLTEPREFFAQMQQLETELGRHRAGHWSPRTVDLDLIFAGDAIIDSADMIIPHPRMHFRRFVVQPIRDLVDDLQKGEPGKLTLAPPIHPLLRSSMDDLLRRMDSGRVFLIADENRHVNLIQRAQQALPSDRLTISPRLDVASTHLLAGLVVSVDLAGSLATTNVAGHQQSVHQSRVAHDRSPQAPVEIANQIDWLVLADPSLLHTVPSTMSEHLETADSTHRDPAGSTDHRTGNTRAGQISNSLVNQVSNAVPGQVGYGPVDQISNAPVEQKSDQFADDTQSTSAIALTWLPVVDLGQTIHFTAIQQFDFFLDSIAPIES